MPYISVVIPVYNSAGYLGTCLENLAKSTCTDFECVVVDDGSTDASAEVARRYGAKVVATEGRRGPAHARLRTGRGRARCLPATSSSTRSTKRFAAS